MLLVLLILLIYFGVVPWFQVDTEFVNPSATPDTSLEGTPIDLRVWIRGTNDTVPQGKVAFHAKSRDLGEAKVNKDGEAVIKNVQLAVGEDTVTFSFKPTGYHYRPLPRGTLPFSPKRISPSQSRYGVVEVTGGGLRALAVTMTDPAKARGRRVCDRSTKSEPTAPENPLLKLAPSEEFTEESVAQVVAGVQERINLLELKELVPKQNIRVVIGSGVQGWSKHPDCALHLL